MFLMLAFLAHYNDSAVLESSLRCPSAPVGVFKSSEGHYSIFQPLSAGWVTFLGALDDGKIRVDIANGKVLSSTAKSNTRKWEMACVDAHVSQNSVTVLLAEQILKVKSDGSVRTKKALPKSKYDWNSIDETGRYVLGSEKKYKHSLPRWIVYDTLKQKIVNLNLSYDPGGGNFPKVVATTSGAVIYDLFNIYELKGNKILRASWPGLKRDMFVVDCLSTRSAQFFLLGCSVSAEKTVLKLGGRNVISVDSTTFGFVQGEPVSLFGFADGALNIYRIK